ncbi:ras-related protein Rap-2a-like [Haliotis rufescens]|uniref:ras-related protein Rap-2a-like n=1 Tax=Haliotis rufescens TaxID=6454 RepID=UPI001EB04602|nr:ras-related protein Rap-2a-like [Haliotis rufescens]
MSCRVAVLGTRHVGKTAIISQFRQKDLKDDMSIYDIQREVFKTHNARLHLDIVDASGIYRAFPMLKSSIINCDAFMLVYSVDDQDSFEVMQRLRHEIIELKMDKNVPIVFVANKQDLPDDKKVVSSKSAEYLIRRKWRHGYVEASSSNYDQVCEAFKQIVRQMTPNVSLTPVLKKRKASAPEQEQRGLPPLLNRLLKRGSI